MTAWSRGEQEDETQASSKRFPAMMILGVGRPGRLDAEQLLELLRQPLEG